MKTRLLSCCGALSLLLSTASIARAQSGCGGPNGSLFNLEPRPNAVVQAVQSVALLPNGAGPNLDLVVETATDARGLGGSNDAFYVQRSNPNCSPDFEGGLPFINSPLGDFGPFGTPTVIADPVRDAFFIVDLRFSADPDQIAVGILRTTATTLLSVSACPGGTQIDSSTCWPTGAVTDSHDLTSTLSSPHIAVDTRAAGSGTGAGDLYTVVTQSVGTGLNTAISLTACTNNLKCGASTVISASNLNADYGFVQVRPDGAITISYRETTFPGINPEIVEFVTCTPKGAPAAPACASPAVVTTENNPVFATLIGNVPMLDQLYPRHVNRLESDGKTVTTFVVYDRCAAAVIPHLGAALAFCPKNDVVVTFSNNDGAGWSPPVKVSASAGQQFFVTPALDTSTGTVNIGYYSTENDIFKLHAQLFLARIAAGSTTVESPIILTADFADVQASPPITVLDQPAAFGDRIGLAAAGTGTAGQSRAYIGYTWNSVFGSYGGALCADVNNHLSSFQY